MPTLKKLINQMEYNDPYIIKINDFIQQEKTIRKHHQGSQKPYRF